jgi:hypothetical protein
MAMSLRYPQLLCIFDSLSAAQCNPNRRSRLTARQRAPRNCVDPVQADGCDSAARNLHDFKTTVRIA